MSYYQLVYRYLLRWVFLLGYLGCQVTILMVLRSWCTFLVNGFRGMSTEAARPA